jgi:hypothetical protein
MPVQIAGQASQCAVLAIQARSGLTGALLIKYRGSLVAEVYAGGTWYPQGGGGNPINPADYTIDATPGSANAAAIVTAWIG